MSYFFGVIGYPAKHSKSPWIHNHFLKQKGNDGIYRIFEASPKEFPKVLDALRTIGIDGFNVTVPYKEMIMEYLDEIDPYAKSIGAVNTVHVRNGKWIGYNTDGKGYVRSLKESFPHVTLQEKKALVIGAGGASRGIYRALVEESLLQIDIANRTVEKAKDLLKLNEQQIMSKVLSLREAEANLSQYDIIINTTAVGMSPNDNAQIISLNHLKKDAIVSDIVYKPFETTLLKEAKSQGAEVHHGHGMLVYQAALAHELWTASSLKADTLLKEFEQHLKGDEQC